MSKVMRELKSIHSSQKSFGNKATVVEEYDKGFKASLYSYNTFILTVSVDESGKAYISDMTSNENDLTNTTMKHAREFLLQQGFDRMTKADLVKIQEEL